jgi:hypothetical protein
MTAAKPTTATILRVAGHVHAWPAGFADGGLPERDWLVVHSRPRQDKILTAELGRLQLPGLLIYERRICRHAGHGKREILVPLLGSYAFVHATEHAREAIYATGRTVSIMTVRQEGAFTRDLADLIALVRRVAGPLLVHPELVPGVRVTVLDGSFAGLHGVIVRRQGLDRLVVNLPVMGTSVSVELPATKATLAVA